MATIYPIRVKEHFNGNVVILQNLFDVANLQDSMMYRSKINGFVNINLRRIRTK